MNNITYPRYINKGSEPPELLLKEKQALESIYQYFDATYSCRHNDSFYRFKSLEKTEDSIKNILSQHQAKNPKRKVFTIFNTLTNSTMSLYNGRISWNGKGAATQSFVYYMQGQGLADFTAEDFHKLVASGIIEVRELA